MDKSAAASDHGQRPVPGAAGRAPVLRLQYRSLTGYCYACDVVAISAEHATLDVIIPGEREPLRLSRIPVLAVDDGRLGICFP